MKPWMRYLALGVPLYLVFLIALFPAGQAWRFAAGPLERALPGLKAGGIGGTVWSGKAGQLAYRQNLLGQASWDISALPLLLGRASVAAMLQRQDGYLQGRIAAPLGGGKVEFAKVEGRLPITELAALVPRLPQLVDGMIALNLPSLVVDEAGRLLSAEGTVTWHQAAITAPQLLALGDLQVALRTEEEGRVIGDLADRGGPLRLSGTLTLSPDRSYRLDATVAAAADAAPELAKALGWLGKPDAEGRYRVNYTGRL